MQGVSRIVFGVLALLLIRSKFEFRNKISFISKLLNITLKYVRIDENIQIYFHRVCESSVIDKADRWSHNASEQAQDEMLHRYGVRAPVVATNEGPDHQPREYRVAT